MTPAEHPRHRAVIKRVPYADRCGQSATALRACFERGVRLDGDNEPAWKRGTGQALSWED